MAAREMGYVSLRDALALLALYAAADAPKFGAGGDALTRAARARVGRSQLRDVLLAAAALQPLPTRPDSALRVLTELSR